MSLLVLGVIALLAGVLLWAGLEKARAFSAFVSVLLQLGIAAHFVRAIATLTIVLELGTAISLIFNPRAFPSLLGLVVLASGFAWAGLTALRRNENIRCSCFGPYSSAVLGRNQLAAFPLWLGAAVLIRLAAPADASQVPSTSLLAVVTLSMGALRAAAALRAAQQARGDRRSAREMYLWLNR